MQLRVWKGMGHAFESVPGLQECKQNMREVFGFLEAHTSKQACPVGLNI